MGWPARRPEIRAREFARSARSARPWLNTDRNTAAQWIEQAPVFSPEMKRLLLPQECSGGSLLAFPPRRCRARFARHV